MSQEARDQPQPGEAEERQPGNTFAKIVANFGRNQPASNG